MVQKTNEITRIRLGFWEEAIGICGAVKQSGPEISLVMENMEITFPMDSQEAILLQQISDNIIGRKIGILKTDLIDKPLVIRLID